MAPRIRRSRRKSNDKHTDYSNEELAIEEIGGSSRGCERESGEKKKGVRGPTYLLDIWCWDEAKPPIKVEFNNTGQPIGRNKGKFTEFLGVLSRNSKFAPIDVFDWRAMSGEKKDKMITMIKERFEIPPGTESWDLRSIGKKWKSWKSRIKGRYYDPTLSLQQLSSKLPRQINKDQWEKLVSHWSLEKSKAVSARNKSHRAKKTMNHTTGKISFAEVRDELEKENGQPPSRVEIFDLCYTDEKGDPTNDDVGQKLVAMRKHQGELTQGSVDTPGVDDSFAKAMGKDPPGLLRMYGLGVSPSDVSGAMPRRATCHRISKENELAISKMEEKVNEQSTQLKEQANQLKSQAPEIAELKAMVLQQSQTNDSPPSNNFRNHSSSFNRSIRSINSIKVGSTVVIRSIGLQGNIAEGRLESLDPSRDVGGTLLGESWCEVRILTPIEWEAQLLRSYSWFKTVGDAIGTSIAWPCHFVSLKD